nr:hypothetical protein Iba_chr04dCG2490 [Ipomoea batatas]GME14963.1 hypothetical protein Iba_scaffold15664CG0010 [Ipomoea batatas]
MLMQLSYVIMLVLGWWDGGLEFQMIMMTHMVVLFILALSMENMLPKHLVQDSLLQL